MNDTTGRIRAGRYGTHVSTTIDGKIAGIAFVIAKDELHRNWVVTGTAVLRGVPSEGVRNVDGGIVLCCRNTKRDCLFAARSIAARGFRTTSDGRIKQNSLKVA